MNCIFLNLLSYLSKFLKVDPKQNTLRIKTTPKNKYGDVFINAFHENLVLAFAPV